MNVPECLQCGLPGTLRLDVYPDGPIVLHDRGAGRKPRRCELPPRDDRLPRITPPPGPTLTWVEYYPSPWKEAS